MKKYLLGFTLASFIMFGSIMTAFAGWQWIDTDSNGVSECYYFTDNGELLTNTTTPDGYTVNENGAWVTNGVVQQKSTAGQTSTSRVWTDGTYSLADACNGDGLQIVNVIVGGNQIIINFTDIWDGSVNNIVYNYSQTLRDDGDIPRDIYTREENGDRFILIAASDGRIYGTTEAANYPILWYQPVSEYQPVRW